MTTTVQPLIPSYNNLCWVGNRPERQHTHKAASPDLYMMMMDMMCNTDEESNQSSGWHQAPVSLFGRGISTRGLLVTISAIFFFTWAEIRLLWNSFRSHSGCGFASCYYQSAGRYTFLDIPKDQILLGCFTVCFSPSFPWVSVLILADWGPRNVRNLAWCTSPLPNCQQEAPI